MKNNNNSNYENINGFIENHISNIKLGLEKHNMWLTHLKHINLLKDAKKINKYILIDGLNYQHKFIKTGNFCNQTHLEYSKNTIEKFMILCKKK